ncbi:MAG: type II toxin-antitoxin system RelE/ParE family toxin [Anaerolineales bacterium]
MRVEFATPASSEFLAAIDFYESTDASLGLDFIEDVEQAVQLIAEFASIGSPAPSSTRRAHLRRFPYALVYQETSELIIVVAVEHHRRKPGFWEDRL